MLQTIGKGINEIEVFIGAVEYIVPLGNYWGIFCDTNCYILNWRINFVF